MNYFLQINITFFRQTCLKLVDFISKNLYQLKEDSTDYTQQSSWRTFSINILNLL